MGACCTAEKPSTIRIKSQASHDGDQTDLLKNKPVDFIQYKLGRTLGHGAWADVVQACDKSDETQQVAIKIMHKNKKNKQLFEREVAIFHELSPQHPNIVPFIGEGEDKHSYFILTGLMTGGELFDHIISDEEEQKVSNRSYPLMLHMLEAVKFCHDHNIVHRDLKPENFVYVDESVASEIALIDFGCSCNVRDDDIIEDIVGTPDYMAPESAINALNNYRKSGKAVADAVPQAKPLTGRILKASDVWAIGIIAYVIMIGRAPFYGDTNQDIYESIVLNPLTFPGVDVRDKKVLNLGDHFKDFVRQTLNKDPEERITIEDALRHPFVTGVTAADFRLNKEVLPWLKQYHFQTKLKKETERILAANMSGEPEKKVLSHFQRLDEDGDGFLDVDELSNLFLHMGYTDCVAKDEAELMIEEADDNGDGKIDVDEFKKVYYRKILSEDDRYIHRVFSVFDRDGDGSIDKNELIAIMAPGRKDKNNLGDTSLVETIEKMFDEVDENKDGVIDFNEFKKAMKEDINAARRFTMRGTAPPPQFQ